MEPNEMSIDVLLAEWNRLLLLVVQPLMHDQRDKDYQELLRYRSSLIKECGNRVAFTNSLRYRTK